MSLYLCLTQPRGTKSVYSTIYLLTKSVFSRFFNFNIKCIRTTYILTKSVYCTISIVTKSVNCTTYVLTKSLYSTISIVTKSVYCTIYILTKSVYSMISIVLQIIVWDTGSTIPSLPVLYLLSYNAGELMQSL